ncbi:hypothetical protein, partial [Lacticaseibacillus paracasei]
KCSDAWSGPVLIGRGLNQVRARSGAVSDRRVSGLGRDGGFCHGGQGPYTKITAPVSAFR